MIGPSHGAKNDASQSRPIGPSSPRLLHVPGAYSSAGGTHLKVIAALVGCHAAVGGRSAVALSDQRDARVPGSDNLFVDYSKVCPRQWFSEWEKRVDAVSGLVGLRRPHFGNLYRPAIEAALDWEPDGILLYEGSLLASVPRWRAAFPRTPLVLYVHNAVSRSFLQRERRNLFAKLDAVVCVSDALRLTTVPRLGRLADAIHVVHNGVDIDFFTPAGRRRRIAGSPLSVLFAAGQIAPHKGAHLLLRAADLAARTEGVEIHLRVVGSSDYDAGQSLSDYERSLRATDVHSRLHLEFVPFVNRETLRQFYRSADVVAVPSDYEDPFPLVVLEAMACGAAVVTSGRGGLREAGGAAAVHVDAHDDGAFAAVLARFANDSDALAVAQQNSLDRASSKSWEEAYHRLAEILWSGDADGSRPLGGRRPPHG